MMADSLLGVDVSHFQTKINWSAVAGSNIDFAFCRATYGTKEDKTFSEHFTRARSAGLVTGAYHFLRFNDRLSAEAQAEAFLETLSDAGALSGPMLPPALDLEDNKKFDEEVNTARERVDYVALAMKWLEIVEKELGRFAIIYTSRSFMKQLGDPLGFSVRPLWVAHYTSRPSPNLPTRWSRYTFWQFTDNGQVPGIDGGVDRNRFDGDRAALAQLTEVSGNVVVAPPTSVEEAEIEIAETELGDEGILKHVVPGGLNIRSKPEVSPRTFITVLPLGHPVEVKESGVRGEWSRVRTRIRNESLEGFVSEKYLRDPLPAPKEALIAATVTEWLRFLRGRGKESQSPYFKYVGEMWNAIDFDHDGRDVDHPWSAAFISFVVRNAGEAYKDFAFSGLHATYIHDAIVKKERGESAPFWGQRLDEHPPGLGDLIARWRQNPRTYDQARVEANFPSHVDVIVRLTPTHAVTIGGNVMNSVFMKENTYQLDDPGFVKPVEKAFVILENRTA